jgi:alkylhydroperoxidase family enzyme
VDAVLKDPATSGLSAAEKALFALIEKVNADSTQTHQVDIDATKAAGWTDEAIYDALTVCALFNFYNVWIDATGVRDMPAMGYQASGQRLAEHGYVVPGE